MKKHSYSIVLLLLWLMLLSGCATTQDRWNSVVLKNSRESYEGFIKRCPDSELAKEAKKRIEDPDYAFMTTCQIGTKEAFEGFVSSYPLSSYTLAAKTYLEFLKETEAGDIKSYKRFISQYPDNIFVPEAKISVPLLWLKERRDKIGVVVNINEVTYKGLFGGGYGNAEAIRQRVWQALKKELNQEGIQQVALLDSLDSSKIIEEEIKDVIIADYSEREPQQTTSYYHPPDYYSSGGAFREGAAQNLKSIFYNPAKEIIFITIKRIKDGVDFFWGFPGLSSSSGNINREEALKTICSNPNPILGICSLKGKELTNSEEREEAETILSRIKSK